MVENVTPLPSALKVHAALILTQMIFGVGAVVGKLGVSTFNPILFALIREAVAGPGLLLCAIAKDGLHIPKRQDLGLFMACGFCVFSNQAFFIVGDKLAGPVIGGAWQCSQPIFALLISLSLGWEKPTLFKILGIAISFAGAAFMLCYGQTLGNQNVGGNILFMLNCLGTAVYVIFAKIALRRYPSLTTTAWSYMFASMQMVIVAFCLNNQCQFISFVCPVEDAPAFQCDTYETSCSAWGVPGNALLPLAYWIVFNSMLAYFLMTWGNQYAKAGFVLAYTAMQPLTSAIVSTVIIAVVGASNTSLTLPGVNALGGIAVVAGVVLVMYDGMRKQKQGDTLVDPLSQSCRE